MKEVAMELIPRMTKEGINKWDEEGKTALFNACAKGMEEVVEMIKKRL